MVWSAEPQHANRLVLRPCDYVWKQIYIAQKLLNIYFYNRQIYLIAKTDPGYNEF